MSESTQHKIDRIRKPRVHITYDVHVGDAIQKKEIPYVIGILADLSGNPKNPLPIISKRQFINIDRDNINDVLKASNARLEFNVPNKINSYTDTLHIELNFKNLKDFEPLSIIHQTPEIEKIHSSKINLLDLLAKMENNPILRDILKLLAEDPDFRNKFKNFIASKKKEIEVGLKTEETPIEDEASIDRILKNKIKDAERKILANQDTASNDSTNDTLAKQFSGISNTDQKEKTDTNIGDEIKASENQQSTTDKSQQSSSQDNNTDSQSLASNKTQKPQSTESTTATETDSTNSTKRPTNVNNPKVEK